MSLRVTSWNIKEGLGDPARVNLIEEGLKQFEDDDLIVLPEAYTTYDSSPKGMADGVLERTTEFAEEYGFKVQEVAYEDKDRTRPLAPKGYQQRMMVFTRPETVTASPIRLATRWGFQVALREEVDAPVTQGIAAHFDDRNEEFRLSMAQSALEALDVSKPALLIGDLNTMPRDSLPAMLLRDSWLLNRAIKRTSNEKMKWAGLRLRAMAEGTTLQYLVDAGLQDAERSSTKRSTYFWGKVPCGKLDHILTAHVKTDSFSRTPLKGSDHIAISAKLELE